MSDAQSKIREMEEVKKVPVDVRHWDALKRAVWHSKRSWEIATREAALIIERCSHMQGCAAESDETQSCLPDCPDREMRMSALVILNAGREFGPLNVVSRPADAPYFAPTREYFVQVLAELVALQEELRAIASAPGVFTLPAGTPPEIVTTVTTGETT